MYYLHVYPPGINMSLKIMINSSLVLVLGVNERTENVLKTYLLLFFPYSKQKRKILKYNRKKKGVSMTLGGIF